MKRHGNESQQLVAELPAAAAADAGIKNNLQVTPKNPSRLAGDFCILDLDTSINKGKGMKKVLLVSLLALLIVPSLVLAHGGVEKSSGNTTVFLTQSPLSPLVGEKVNLTFVLGRTGGSTERLAGVEVLMTVIDTGADESQDKEIYSVRKTTDANGAVVLDYSFTKENFFDVELSYRDPANNRSEEVGFLVQTRSASQATSPINEQPNQPPVPMKSDVPGLVIAFVGGLVVGVLIQRSLKRS